MLLSVLCEIGLSGYNLDGRNKPSQLTTQRQRESVCVCVCACACVCKPIADELAPSLICHA